MALIGQAWRHGWDLAHDRYAEQPSGGAVGLLGTRKRPDYSERPAGALVWLLILATPAVVEVVALLVGRIDYTLSRSIWWALGPAGEIRWFLLGFPLAAFMVWVGPHFLWPHRWDGMTLLVMVVLAFAIGCVGALTHGGMG